MPRSSSRVERRSSWLDSGPDVSVVLLSLELLKHGFDVHVPTDACGAISAKAHERAISRLIQAGAVPTTSLQVLFELLGDEVLSEAYEDVMEVLKHRGPSALRSRIAEWKKH